MTERVIYLGKPVLGAIAGTSLFGAAILGNGLVGAVSYARHPEKMPEASFSQRVALGCGIEMCKIPLIFAHLFSGVSSMNWYFKTGTPSMFPDSDPTHTIKHTYGQNLPEA